MLRRRGMPFRTGHGGAKRGQPPVAGRPPADEERGRRRPRGERRVNGAWAALDTEQYMYTYAYLGTGTIVLQMHTGACFGHK